MCVKERDIYAFESGTRRKCKYIKHSITRSHIHFDVIFFPALLEWIIIFVGFIFAYVESMGGLRE